MATLFRVRKSASNAGSGGKIMRGRRVPDVQTPYTRPISSSSPSPEENPSRFLGLISPASRIITGAAKMISTVFFPDTPPTSSSSEDDSGDDDDISSDGSGRLYQNGDTLEGNNAEENLQLNVRKNEIKLAIEQLLMQETFSRAECDKLVKIMESRVVEFPVIKEGGSATQSVLADRATETSNTLQGDSHSNWQARKPASYSHLGNGFDSPYPRVPVVDGHIPDICNTAVMEAKKWVEEKKTESYIQLDKNQGALSSNPCMLSNVSKGEEGSPVLVAKSYMKSRPPWASPTIGHIGFQTISPIGSYPSLEGTHAMSTTEDLKRSSHAIDSWNSSDGSRRVRFKSAENTVQPLSAPGNSHKKEKTSVDDIVPGTHDGPPDQSAIIADPKVRCTTSENMNPASQSVSNDLPRVNGPDELSVQPEDMQTMEASRKHQGLGLNETRSFDDSRSVEDHGKQKEINGPSERVAANGFPSVNGESSPEEVCKEGAQNVIVPSDDKFEGSCELLSEASVEIPQNLASGSLTSSSRQSKERVPTKTESVSSPGMKKRASTRIEKQQGLKKAGTYSRRGGRGRGK